MVAEAREEQFQRRVVAKNNQVQLLPAVKKAFEESRAIRGK
jgi:hypothetical protein